VRAHTLLKNKQFSREKEGFAEYYDWITIGLKSKDLLFVSLAVRATRAAEDI
jgi:hypothetical protein